MSIHIGAFRLSPEFLTKRKLRRQCDDYSCNGACCAEGVFLTVYDAQRIVQHGSAIQKYLVEPYDFASWNMTRPGYVSTPVYSRDPQHEHCWFLMRNARCAVHTYALEQGIPVQDLKPYFCRMFPLTLVDLDIDVTEIAIDPKAYDTCLVPAEQENYLFTQFETELRRTIGDAGYAQLGALAA